ncbi:hypothetical protein [Gordonia paraffinivorans]|uniref:hypothetical protein n=1 Tax=Gordonia paraffinivorans TaxID=175628 RepID=UPI0014487857|nr:hypothetical protein [Gordonia paraffinivorans]
MTPRGTDDADFGERPEPPYSAETLADFHAGLLSARAAEHIRSRIQDDTEAQRILAALDRTVDDLRGLPPEPASIPDSVRSGIQATLSSLPACPQGTTPAPEAIPAPVDLDTRRRSRVLSMLLAAAAVVVVAAGTFGLVRQMSPTTDPAPSTLAQPTSPADTLDPGSSASALSVIGRQDGAPFGSVAALRRCTAAHLVPAQVAVVGSGQITYQGRPAAAILLSTGVAGLFDALIVGLDCDTDTPSLLARGTIGG